LRRARGQRCRPAAPEPAGGGHARRGRGVRRGAQGRHAAAGRGGLQRLLARPAGHAARRGGRTMLRPRTQLLNLGERLLPLAARLPFALQRLALERSLNHLFAEPLADDAFEVLEGRWMRLEVVDLKLAWCLTCDRKRLRIAEQTPVQVTIRGNWREFLLLASRQEDPDTLFFRRRLVIEGDTELGLAIKNLIDSLDPDMLPAWLWKGLQGAGEEV